MMKKTNTFKNQRQIEEINKYFADRLDKKDAQLLNEFTLNLFSYVAEDDLQHYDDEDFKGLIATLFRAMQAKPSNEAMIFNPNVEEHGWQSQHSILIMHHTDVRYLIDSIRNMLNQKKIKIHRLFHAYFSVERDASGELTELVELGKDKEKSFSGTNELFLYMEIDQHTHKLDLQDLNKLTNQTIFDVEVVAKDYPDMLLQVDELIKTLSQLKHAHLKDTIKETVEFLNWLKAGQFTFLAYDEYILNQQDINLLKEKSLGLFRSWEEEDELVECMSISQLEAGGKDNIITFAKSGQLSTVHRQAYLDYVVINRFDDKGNIIGGYRLMGLYKHNVYLNNATEIPVVREKIQTILRTSNIPQDTYNYVELSHILATFPRDELFQASVDYLLDVTLSVLYLQERHKVKLFIRQNIDQRFITAIVYAPKARLNTRLTEQVYELLANNINVESSTTSTWFSESSLARFRIVFKLTEPLKTELNQIELERHVTDLASDWYEGLQNALNDSFGEEKGVLLYRDYKHSFPVGYTDENSPRVAVADIQRMQLLSQKEKHQLAFSFYRSITAEDNQLKIKIYHRGQQLALSDMIPVLENFGLKVIEEIPYDIELKNEVYWIYNFTVDFPDNPDIKPDDYRDNLSDAFLSVWCGESDNDSFNRLVLQADLNWRQVSMLRAYARYMKQIAFGFSAKFIATSLSSHKAIVKKLIGYFDCRFNPEKNRSDKTAQRLIEQLNTLFEGVTSLSHDRILRQYLELMTATLRTNFFQHGPEGKDYKPYLSLKFDTAKLKNIPLPKPMYEIFVYSSRMEGVHLRGGKVARGGLRWSDRTEDYRTEVLGLVKAQQVKNAVIVPVGAKGGFIAKRLPPAEDRDGFRAEGVACYQWFIRGLLDITDNIIEGEVSPPINVVRYDEDDPYLVVAADKGTATFSDIANEISIEYDHWLGDAFASGGSNGYDHKKMGITAKGAWVSVQRHFREMNINIQQQAFTVVGIGDMSGDVFGNGMLLSEQIKLVGGFNHLHIFIDPSPKTKESFLERQRLFQLPRSSWDDYDKKLISKGGGVFSRSAKSIPLSPEMKGLLNTDASSLPPTEIVSLLLKANIDLLWNGGIGTYVKASHEQHADVGDKANDGLRVNACDLQCKVIGEGGNLGITQNARIEFALNGGSVFTDFIDNAAGVDCSDHEVNIKILLDKKITEGDLTQKQRNGQLEKMTDSVSRLVLKNNYLQTQSIALATKESARRTEEYRRVIHYLESKGKLNRELEFLPSDEVLSDRKNQQLGLSQPELSVLISYVKSDMKEVLGEVDLGDDIHITRYLESAFPNELVKKFKEAVINHPLKNEIIATQIANDMFNYMGISFVDRIHQSTGASHENIAKAYVASKDIFSSDAIWTSIEALDNKVNSELQYSMMLRVSRLIRRGTRWLIKNHRSQLEVSTLILLYQDYIQGLRDKLPSLLPEPLKEQWQQAKDDLIKQGIPEPLSITIASCDYLYNFLGIIAASNTIKKELNVVAGAFFELAEKLDLDDFSTLLETKMPTNTYWQSMARESLRDDLEWQQRLLTQNMLSSNQFTDDMTSETIKAAIDQWLAHEELLVSRWKQMVIEVTNYNETDTSILNIALRELSDLSQATIHVDEEHAL